MSNIVCRVILVMLATIVLLASPLVVHAEVKVNWPFRYLMMVKSEGDYYAGRRNAQRRDDGINSPIEAYLMPTLLIKGPEESGLALFLMEFDRQGRLLDQKTRKPTKYRGVYDPERFEEDGVGITLAHADLPAGNDGDVILGFYNPINHEFCDFDDLERIKREVANPPDPTEPEDYYSFNCKDWAAQLKSPKIKVIDVGSDGDGEAIIGNFIGFSRFTDKKKPVWGNHGGRYYCFADCPAGKPGRVKWVPPPATRGADY